jgi:hypothetical protein
MSSTGKRRPRLGTTCQQGGSSDWCEAQRLDTTAATLCLTASCEVLQQNLLKILIITLSNGDAIDPKSCMVHMDFIKAKSSRECKRQVKRGGNIQ